MTKPTPSTQVYIPASRIPNYDGFCPLIGFWGHTQEDGSFLTHFNDEFSVPAESIIWNAGFLILEIGGVEIDNYLKFQSWVFHKFAV